MLDTLDQSAIHHIRKLVSDGCELRIIFDNFDFKILTNIILKGKSNEVFITCRHINTNKFDSFTFTAVFILCIDINCCALFLRIAENTHKLLFSGYKNADMQWITQYITFDRVSSTGLCNSKPIVFDINEFENKNYLLSKEELEKLRSEYMSRVCSH